MSTDRQSALKTFIKEKGHLIRTVSAQDAAYIFSIGWITGRLALIDDQVARFQDSEPNVVTLTQTPVGSPRPDFLDQPLNEGDGVYRP